MQPQWIEDAAVRSMMGDTWWLEQKIRALAERADSLEQRVLALEIALRKHAEREH